MRSSGGSSRSRLIHLRLSADHPAGLRGPRVEKRAEIMDNLARLKLDSYGRFPRNHQHLGKRQKRYEEAAKRLGHVEVRSTDERILQAVEGEDGPPYPLPDDQPRKSVNNKRATFADSNRSIRQDRHYHRFRPGTRGAHRPRRTNVVINYFNDARGINLRRAKARPIRSARPDDRAVFAIRGGGRLLFGP